MGYQKIWHHLSLDRAFYPVEETWVWAHEQNYHQMSYTAAGTWRLCYDGPWPGRAEAIWEQGGTKRETWCKHLGDRKWQQAGLDPRMFCNIPSSEETRVPCKGRKRKAESGTCTCGESWQRPCSGHRVTRTDRHSLKVIRPWILSSSLNVRIKKKKKCTKLRQLINNLSC